MTTGIQDSNGNPGSLPTKVSPVAADSVEILDSANSNKPAVATLNSLPYVQKAGDTMTGFLTLNADPVLGLEAATKQYVDSAVGGGAPNSATYITQTPNGGLTNEQAMSLLTTGLMKNTTATGVVSIAVQGVDYYEPGGTDVALADGGTNASLTASNGGIVYSTAAAMDILAGTATARQMLQSGASAAPSWSTATYPATTTINRILYSSAANVIGEITTANNGILVTSAGGVPSIGTAIPNGVTATTQAANDNSTKLATTAYADAVGTSSGGLVLIASATASTSATLDLPASMSSTYDNYFCTLENFITPSNSNTLEARFGTGAGPTYVASGYLDNAAATTFISVSGASNFGNTANSSLGGFFYLTNTQNTTNWKSLHGLTNFTGPTSSYVQAICGGTLASATALTSLRLLLASGSITTGTIKIYGIKN